MLPPDARSQHRAMAGGRTRPFVVMPEVPRKSVSTSSITTNSGVRVPWLTEFAAGRPSWRACSRLGIRRRIVGRCGTTLRSVPQDGRPSTAGTGVAAATRTESCSRRSTVTCRASASILSSTSRAAASRWPGLTARPSGQPRQRLDFLEPEAEVLQRERGRDVAAVLRSGTSWCRRASAAARAGCRVPRSSGWCGS